jgi:hypothetical protein
MFAAIRSLLHKLARTLSDSFSGNRYSRMTNNGGGIVMAWPIGTTPGDFPVPRSLPLPLLTHLEELDATEWLRESLTTFARSVASFLPGNFAAYARVYHPFELTDSDGTQSTSSWRNLPELAGCDISDPKIAGEIAMNGLTAGQASMGTPPRPIIEALIDHLQLATATPEECYFAVWEGFGGSAVPSQLMPKLELPNRAYHVFAGPLTAALSGYDAYSFGHHDQFANLWWPADHAWCVATEVDSVWTHVGGSRECIDAILRDPRLEAMETSADARW